MNNIALQYNNPIYSDMIVELKDGRRISCHRLMLGMASEMLAAMFAGADGDLVVLDKYSAETTEIVLKFIYGIEPQSLYNMPDKQWIELLQAAHSMMVGKLVTHLCVNISNDVMFSALICLGYTMELPALVITAAKDIFTDIHNGDESAKIRRVAATLREMSNAAAVQNFMATCVDVMNPYDVLAIDCHCNETLNLKLLQQISLYRFSCDELKKTLQLPGIAGNPIHEYFINEILLQKQPDTLPPRHNAIIAVGKGIDLVNDSTQQIIGKKTFTTTFYGQGHGNR